MSLSAVQIYDFHTFLTSIIIIVIMVIFIFINIIIIRPSESQGLLNNIHGA